jgi:cytochrome P450
VLVHHGDGGPFEGQQQPSLPSPERLTKLADLRQADRVPTQSAVDAADLLDLGDPAVAADPYPHLAALRAAAPLAWHSGMGMWLASGHAEAGAVLRDRRLGRVFGPRTPDADWDTFNWLHADSILDSEPPKHTRLRRLVAGAFGRGHVQRLGPRIQELANELLADLPDGEFDVIERYAEPLPVLVIAELLGVPEADRHHLRPWSQAIVRMYEVDRSPADEAAARAASGEFAAYVEELAAQRAKAPGDDLLSDLVSARDGSDRLSARELVATAVLLLNAGHEASVNGFGNGLHSWLTAPDRPSLDVGDQAAVTRMVEEFLRHDSPLHLFERTAKEPTEVAGVALQPGDKVAALLGAANRDPAVFADPDRFDGGRDPNPHLAFGAGIHFCIGAPLARLELEISVRTMLARFPDLIVVEAKRRPTFVLRGFERLVVSPRA